MNSHYWILIIDCRAIIICDSCQFLLPVGFVIIVTLPTQLTALCAVNLSRKVTKDSWQLQWWAYNKKLFCLPVILHPLSLCLSKYVWDNIHGFITERAMFIAFSLLAAYCWCIMWPMCYLFIITNHVTKRISVLNHNIIVVLCHPFIFITSVYWK